jgi:hypothetical protein
MRRLVSAGSSSCAGLAKGCECKNTFAVVVRDSVEGSEREVGCERREESSIGMAWDGAEVRESEGVVRGGERGAGGMRE